MAYPGPFPEYRDFETEMLAIRESDGSSLAEFYLSRGSCKPDGELYGRAVLSVVNGALCMDVISLSPGDLLELSAFLQDYAMKIREDL